MVGLPLSVVSFLGCIPGFYSQSHDFMLQLYSWLKYINVNLPFFTVPIFPLEVAQVGAHLSNSRLGSVAPEIGEGRVLEVQRRHESFYKPIPKGFQNIFVFVGYALRAIRNDMNQI